MFFMVKVFQSPGFSGSRFLQSPGFSGSRFFKIQLFQSPGFLGARVRVQGLGRSFRSSRLTLQFGSKMWGGGANGPASTYIIIISDNF